MAKNNFKRYFLIMHNAYLLYIKCFQEITIQLEFKGSLSYCNLHTSTGKKRNKDLDTDFKYSVGGNLINFRGKPSSSYGSCVLTFVLIEYKKWISCSKPQHSETMNDPVRDCFW